MRDAQRELDQRARLAEEDQRIDARERGLAELRDRRFLAVARFQLGAQAQQLGVRAGLRVALAGNEVEQWVFGHS